MENESVGFSVRLPLFVGSRGWGSGRFDSVSSKPTGVLGMRRCDYVV